MMQKIKWILAASLAANLAACGGGMPANTSLYSENQPVVTRDNYVFDVNLNSNGIASSEKVRISQWMDALDVRYGDRISLDYGNGYKNAAANSDIAEIAAQKGLLIAKNAPVTEGNIYPGTIRVIVTRSSASVPNCPNWSNTKSSDFKSSTSPGYGCAVNSNMAAMIADPEDLIRGKDGSSSSPRAGNKAVETYQSKTTGDN